VLDECRCRSIVCIVLYRGVPHFCQLWGFICINYFFLKYFTWFVYFGRQLFYSLSMHQFSSYLGMFNLWNQLKREVNVRSMSSCYKSLYFDTCRIILIIKDFVWISVDFCFVWVHNIILDWNKTGGLFLDRKGFDYLGKLNLWLFLLWRNWNW
jgi:hypothetical protein